MSCSATERKAQMYEKAKDLFSTHENYMLLSIKRVKSTQFKDVKAAIGPKVKFLIAKNKIIKRALEDLDSAKYTDLIDQLHGDVIIAFFDGTDPKTVLQASRGNMRKALAMPGDVATDDVIVPAGPTGLGPEKISIFQNARIITKINKGKIEIANDHKLVQGGEVVTISNAKLLGMLNVLPFEFGLDILKVFEGKETYGKKLLDVSEDDVTSAFESATAVIAAISLGTGITTEASVPFEVRNAFADVVKVSLATGFTIRELN